MEFNVIGQVAALAAALYVLRKAQIRLRLSRAKHPSLRGHSKLSRRIAKLVPMVEYSEAQFFRSDGAPEPIQTQRRAAFEQLAQRLQEKAPKSIAASEALESTISDVRFTNAYRVPFQYRSIVRERLRLGTLVEATDGVRVRDLDGNWSYDLSGSYGVNVFGYDFYKECMREGLDQTRDLGPVLGPYHPVIADNVKRLTSISGMDEVSFHMSGTEAVMQAVRLARYHTGRSHLVRFCGAYHGWWDGVQPGIGNQREINDVYTLKDMDADTLLVLRTRKDIACVLINPLQALHPNADAASDATLVNSERSARFDYETYTKWLRTLREVCTGRGIVLIFDEVFVGFRLAPGGAQEFYDVKADMVTYGKTLGGGLPLGVVCGKRHLMKRFREDRPTDLCFARGTFNSHPMVMGAMNAFLRRLDDPAIRQGYQDSEAIWNRRAADLNQRLQEADLPVAVANLCSIWTVTYSLPSRYNWMLQYYLRDHGLMLSWIGTGRFIFSHDYSDEDFEAVCRRFIEAARSMKTDGWWWQGGGLTNKSIKRQVLKEFIETRFRRRVA